MKVGNGSNDSDHLNNSMDHNSELNNSQLSGVDLNISQTNAEAETDNVSSNMLNASVEEQIIE